MNNEKRKGILAEYSYLNNRLPLEGWIWEFIRRNHEYRRLYSEIKKPHHEREPYYGKPFNFFLSYFGMESTINADAKTPLPEKHFIVSQRPGISNKLKPKDVKSSHVSEGFPNPDIRFKDFKQYKPIILKGNILKALIPSTAYKKASYPRITDPYLMPEHWINKDKQLSRTGLDLHHGDEGFNWICVHAMTSAIEINEMEDTIYFGVSKYADPADVKKELDTLYKDFIETVATPREMKLQWHSYLIAYDLKESGYRVKDIARIIYPRKHNCYPHYKLSKKISKRIKEVGKLINERQYLKFLSLNISKEFRK